MVFIPLIAEKLSKLVSYDDLTIDDDTAQKRDKFAKSIIYKTLQDMGLESSIVKDSECLLRALLDSKNVYSYIIINMDEYAETNHIIKDQGEPIGVLSYIITAWFYLNYVSSRTDLILYLIHHKYLPILLKVFINPNNGLANVCVYELSEDSSPRYKLVSEHFDFYTNIVLGFVNIKQNNEDDFDGSYFIKEFSNDKELLLKNAIGQCINDQLSQNTKNKHKIIQISEDTCVDANYVCPMCLSSENIDRILGTLIRTRNKISFEDNKPIRILKNHDHIDFTLDYDNNLYSWFLDKHITCENPPREFNPIYEHKTDSYYKQWNLDCVILVKRSYEDSLLPYHERYDTILKEKYVNIPFSDLTKYISWFDNQNDNPLVDELFISSKDIIINCDKRMIREIFCDEDDLEMFFKLYYRIILSDIHTSMMIFNTLIKLNKKYLIENSRELYVMLTDENTAKTLLLKYIYEDDKYFDMILWLELQRLIEQENNHMSSLSYIIDTDCSTSDITEILNYIKEILEENRSLVLSDEVFDKNKTSKNIIKCLTNNLLCDNYRIIFSLFYNKERCFGINYDKTFYKNKYKRYI